MILLRMFSPQTAMTTKSGLCSCKLIKFFILPPKETTLARDSRKYERFTNLQDLEIHH